MTTQTTPVSKTSKIILTALITAVVVVAVGNLFDSIGVGYGVPQALMSVGAGVAGSVRLFYGIG